MSEWGWCVDVPEPSRDPGLETEAGQHQKEEFHQNRNCQGHLLPAFVMGNSPNTSHYIADSPLVRFRNPVRRNSIAPPAAHLGSCQRSPRPMSVVVPVADLAQGWPKSSPSAFGNVLPLTRKNPPGLDYSPSPKNFRHREGFWRNPIVPEMRVVDFSRRRVSRVASGSSNARR